MGTVTPLRTRVNVTPLRARRPLTRDRGLDLRLVPGSVVDHPAGHGHPCRAILVRRNPPDAHGTVNVADGIHDWLITWCPEEPAAVGEVCSFATLEGARLVRWTPNDARMALAARHQAGGGAA